MFLPRRALFVESEAVEGSDVESMVDVGWAAAAARERVVIGVVVGAAAEARERLADRVVGPEDDADVDASTRFRLRVSIQKKAPLVDDPVAD